MRKKAYYKNIFKEITGAFGRFISIFAITALGAGFFAGLKTTGPAMLNLADDYYSNNQLMDFRVVSPLGFSQDDVENFEEMQGVQNVMAGHAIDLLVDVDEGEETARLFSLPQKPENENKNYLNRVIVDEGRLPEKPNECFVDKVSPHKIGDEIVVAKKNAKETKEFLKHEKFTVVGKGRTPLYISFQRGNTNVGDGRVALFVYVPFDAFDAEDMYTDIYLRIENSDTVSAFSQQFKQSQTDGVKQLEKMGEVRAPLRYDNVLKEANEKIADAKKELEDGEKEASEKIADAQTEIDDGIKKLADGQKTIDENKQKLIDAKKEIVDGKAKLADGKTQITEKTSELQKGKLEIEKQEKAYAENKKLLDDKEKEYQKGYSAFKKQETTFLKGEAPFLKAKAEFEAGLSAYDAGMMQYQNAVNAVSSLEEAVQGLEALNTALAALLAQMQPALPAPSLEAVTVQFTQTALQSIGILQQTSGGMQTAGMQEIAQPLLQAASAAQNALDNGDYQTVYGVLASVPQSIKPAISGARAAFAQNLQELEKAKAGIDAAAPQIEENAAKIAQGRADIEKARNDLALGKQQLDDGQAQLASGRVQLDEATAQIVQGEAALSEAVNMLLQSEKELANGEKEIINGERELINAENEIADAKIELEDGQAKLLEKKAEAEKEIADGREKIEDAQKELNKIKPTEWLVMARNSNAGYSGFKADAERIDAIAQVITIFFFLVAALVCLTTMTRMVEEQRTQIGVFKALGYSNFAIAMKYLWYAGFATVSGAVVGVVCGSIVFPKVIWNAYGMLYMMPAIATKPHLLFAAISIGGFTLCTVAATLFACKSELRSQPSVMMRPKAPPAGKKVVLEKITFLWKRLNFSQKVTMHNLFRNKRRLFMTIVGVMGCTALLLTGFGLRNSIVGIADLQFGKIYKYDIIVSVKDGTSQNEKNELDNILASSGESLHTFQSAVSGKSSSGNTNGMTTNIYVAKDIANIDEFISLQERKTQNKLIIPQQDGVVITEKLAKKLKLEVGDTFDINRASEKHVQVKVAGITENYALNYIYMAPLTYENLFKEAPDYNTVLLKMSEDNYDEKQVLRDIIEVPQVAGAVGLAEMKSELADMFESLNAVILVIILSAALLAIVVLYNLTNINITERQREIATLKVLGFYENEVAWYVYRETLILTFIGSVVGLVMGVLLHAFVIKTAEVDEMMFLPDVLFSSYAWAILLTLACAMAVNLFMLKHLKSVNMVESLKSSE